MKLNTLRRGTAAAAVFALSVTPRRLWRRRRSRRGSADDTTSQSPRDPRRDAGRGGDHRRRARRPSAPAAARSPPTGAGSFNGMVQDPVATAASNNPLLQTLVAAVGAVDGLGDTLNSQPRRLTVFAPAEGAFAEIPPEDLKGLLDGAGKEA